LISNSTALICLSKINKLDLLRKVYSIVNIPSAVKSEVLIEGKEGYISIHNAIKSGWIEVTDPKKNTNLGLGAGENQAINLALEKKDTIIIDDAFAIKAAKALNVPFVRTSGVIFTALNNEIINKIHTLTILNQLIDIGYYISTREYTTLISKLK
jgi:predicted nucleic acid-binding protein